MTDDETKRLLDELRVDEAPAPVKKRRGRKPAPEVEPALAGGMRNMGANTLTVGVIALAPGESTEALDDSDPKTKRMLDLGVLVRV